MKKSKIDEVLEKVFTSTDLASGGLLNPDQSARFVQGIFDSAVVSIEARREPMRANKKQIDKITFTGDILQKPVAEGTEHTTTTSPTTSKVVLDAQEFIVAIDLGYSSLEDSIEGGNIENTILDMASRKLGFEVDEVILNGDTAGATGTKLDVIDGIFKQITTNVFDIGAGGSTFLDADALSSLYKKLPSKFAKNMKEWRYYTPHLAKINYVDFLAGKNVNDAFSKYLIEGAEPSYQGIPVRDVPAISSTGPTKMLLIHPKNIVVGMHRDITMEMERRPRHRKLEVTITLKMDVKLEREDACVKGTNLPIVL